MKKTLEDKCFWKVRTEYPASTTFKSVMDGHTLYNCAGCSGKRNSCPSYQNHYSLLIKNDTAEVKQRKRLAPTAEQW